MYETTAKLNCGVCASGPKQASLPTNNYGKVHVANDGHGPSRAPARERGWQLVCVSGSGLLNTLDGRLCPTKPGGQHCG